MVSTREEAARHAEASTTNTPGTCQLWTRTQYGAPSAGDRDRDGDADAVDGWLSEPASARHTDRNPPRGVPVAWSGGSNGFGHRAISLGGGKIRSTDAGGSGRVATVDLGWVERTWGLKYLGWSDTITGLTIPTGAPVKPLRATIVDISHHQAGLDIGWAAARKAGVRVLMHKVTEGATVVDTAYRRRRAEGDAFNRWFRRVFGIGIRQGGYHYASPDGADAIAEADWFLKHLIRGNFDAAPWLDFEELNGLTLTQADRWCVRWIERVKAAGYERVGLYTPFDLPTADAAADFTVRARYNSTNEPPVLECDVHQFSDGKGGVPNSVTGFGHVDLNALRNGFRVRDLKLKDLTVVPEPDPEPEPPLVLTPGDVGLGVQALKWDASAAAWASGIVQAFRTTKPLPLGVLVLTETTVDGKLKEALSIARTQFVGLSSVRYDQAPGQSNAANVFDATRVELLLSYPVQLATTTWTTAKGFKQPPNHSLVCVYRVRETGALFALQTVHLPVGAFHADGSPGGALRHQAFTECLDAIPGAFDRALKEYPSATRVLAGDFNLRPRNEWVRRLWGDELPNLTFDLEDTAGVCWVAVGRKRGTFTEARSLGLVRFLDHRALVGRLVIGRAGDAG